jgi:hypothetical protein
MKPAAPYIIDDEAKWNEILDRHRIKKNRWKNISEFTKWLKQD